MRNRSLYVYESFTREHNASILKASEEARMLRSLSKKSESKTKEPSREALLPRLVSSLSSLIKVHTQQPA